MKNEILFKPGLLNTIAILIPAGGLGAISSLLLLNGTPIFQAAEFGLVCCVLAVLYALAWSPFYSLKLAFHEKSVSVWTWYSREEFRYEEIESLDVFVWGSYGSHGLKVQIKGRDLPWVIKEVRFETGDFPKIVRQFALHAPHAELTPLIREQLAA